VTEGRPDRSDPESARRRAWTWQAGNTLRLTLSEIWRNRQFQGRSESAIANTWLMEALPMAETSKGKKFVKVKSYTRVMNGKKVSVRASGRSTPKTSKGKR
jgi:hypothetical protein